MNAAPRVHVGAGIESVAKVAAEAVDLARQRGLGPLTVSLSHAAGISTATGIALGRP